MGGRWISEEKVFRVIKLLEKGKSAEKTAYSTGVSASTVNRIKAVLKLYKAEEWGALKEHKNGKYPLNGHIYGAIEHYLGVQPPRVVEEEADSAPTETSKDNYDSLEILERMDTKFTELLTAIKHIGILLENNTKAQYELLKIWRNG